MSLIVLQVQIEAKLQLIKNSMRLLKERTPVAKNEFTQGYLTGKADGLEDERHTLENLLKYLGNLIEQSQNLDVEPQNSPLEQPSFLLCAKISNEQINDTRL